MREINEIILHCAATPEGRHVTVSTIRKWHLDRGWTDIGYHYVIYLDGTVHTGRPVEQQGAHVSGHNKGTIGVCYVGGVDSNQKPKDTRTPAQTNALHKLCADLKADIPSITKISGHNEYAARACPSFNVHPEFDYILKGEAPSLTKPTTPTKFNPVFILPVLAVIGIVVFLITKIAGD